MVKPSHTSIVITIEPKEPKIQSGFTFINDSQITLPGNHSAWLIEYTKLLGVEKNYEILTIGDNGFY
jgi:hypothetical protein